MTQSTADAIKSRGICVAESAQSDYGPGAAGRLQHALDEQRRIEIGQRIKRFRGQMRQHQAAEKLNVPLRTYQTWEAGKNATDLDNYGRIAQLFGVRLQDILGNENGEPPWVEKLRERLDQTERKLDLLLAFVEERVAIHEEEEAARGLAESPPAPRRASGSNGPDLPRGAR